MWFLRGMLLWCAAVAAVAYLAVPSHAALEADVTGGAGYALQFDGIDDW